MDMVTPASIPASALIPLLRLVANAPPHDQKGEVTFNRWVEAQRITPPELRAVLTMLQSVFPMHTTAATDIMLEESIAVLGTLGAPDLRHLYMSGVHMGQRAVTDEAIVSLPEHVGLYRAAALVFVCSSAFASTTINYLLNGPDADAIDGMLGP
jgi:hypothetical protein